jgi:hypothetical protein
MSMMIIAVGILGVVGVLQPREDVRAAIAFFDIVGLIVIAIGAGVVPGFSWSGSSHLYSNHSKGC